MYLGIDIGTSSVKAVLIDADQRIVASRSEPLEVERPHPGWSEQDPESWVDGDLERDRRALPRPPEGNDSASSGIGLSGQMHGATLLDKADRPLRPCILWNDGRSAEEAAELDADPRFRADHRQHRLSRLHRAEARLGAAARAEDLRQGRQGAAAEGLCPAAGSPATTPPTCRIPPARRGSTSRSATGRTSCSRATHLDRDQMPELFEGTEPTGKLRGGARDALGHDGPPVVAGGGGDNAASACGVGTVAPGAAFVSLGTSGVLFVSNEQFRPNAASAVHAFCHALPNTWHQMGVILSAAASLEWLAGVTGASAAELDRDARRQAPPAEEPLFFLPYLSGERTPHNDAARARQLRRALAPDRPRGAWPAP